MIGGRVLCGAGLVLLLATGCDTDRSYPSAPVSGASASCSEVCNSEYDTCQDRLNANPMPNRPNAGADTPEEMLGGSGHCSDELKSCLKSCPG